FDADVGRDAHGRPVVTFSRCASDPAPPPAVPGFFAPNGLPEPARGSGCRIRVLDLTTQRERALALRVPSGASDATPSMWDGDVPFARRSRGATVDQVLLWSHATRRTITLRHGVMPKGNGSGDVQSLDLDRFGVAFLWSVEGPGVEGVGPGWEVR